MLALRAAFVLVGIEGHTQERSIRTPREVEHLMLVDGLE